jgi:hypothetical protein
VKSRLDRFEAALERLSDDPDGVCGAVLFGREVTAIHVIAEADDATLAAYGTEDLTVALRAVCQALLALQQAKQLAETRQ